MFHVIRYHYVDGAVAAALKKIYNSGLRKAVLSYDIACKYKVNFYLRISTQNKFGTSLLPIEMQEYLLDRDRFLPKVNQWHLGSHIETCADDHSLRTTPNVGRFHGEQVETPWARLDLLQYSTREMNAGHRRDTITAHMNHWNNEKRKKLGELRPESVVLRQD